jgi:UDP-2-acetamido-3-amino-2,3-dideoxy-glucuronate N-acetyltransferase
MAGVPGRQIGWMSKFGEKLELPLEGTAQTRCPNTKELYHLKDGHVQIIEG